MNAEWIDYLRGEGALFVDQVITGFQDSDSDLPSASGFVALTDLAIVRISGEDALNFLQAHFCNDVAQINDGSGQLSGYCSPKGRLLAIFHLFNIGGDFFMVVPAELVESLIKRLSMFAQMMRPVGKQLIGNVSHKPVILQDVSDEYVSIGTYGAVDLRSLETGPVALASLPGTQEHLSRTLCLLTTEAARTVWTNLKEQAAPVSRELWRLQDIQAGLPVVLQQTQDTFVPQMVNLHLLDGVSFNKGCYPGQEIVARMQYLGKLKRQMHRFLAETDQIEPGTTLVSVDDSDAGVVVQSAYNPVLKVNEFLAVIKLSATETALHLDSLHGVQVSAAALPYSLEAPQ